MRVCKSLIEPIGFNQSTRQVQRSAAYAIIRVSLWHFTLHTAGRRTPRNNWSQQCFKSDGGWHAMIIAPVLVIIELICLIV
jgi:hypothetical protein